VTWLSAQQFAGFQRAASRRSRGQVTIPDVRLSLAEATALWTDIRAAFGPPKGRNLAPQELGHLRRRAWRRSSGFASLSAPALSLEAALAFWRLAGKLGVLAARRKASPRSKVAGAAVLGLAATQMAACTTFLGSNIKGSFSCNAPGGTCAPSTVIDDQALSVIQNARPMTPAGPYFQPSARRPAPVAAIAPAGRGRLAAASEGLVHRERRVLKVVFPSYVDGAGNLHEPRIVHTVADEGGWMQLSSGAPNAGDQLAGRSEAAAAIPASLTDTMTATMPKADGAALVSRDIPGQAMTAPQAQGGPPDPKLVAEARARGTERRAASPVDAIKAQVQAQLARVPKAPDSVGTVQSPPLERPAEPAASQPAAQGAAQSQLPPAPKVANPPAGFSGKIEE
jgi:conjugal transfer pilus assembly protein TraV